MLRQNGLNEHLETRTGRSGNDTLPFQVRDRLDS